MLRPGEVFAGYAIERVLGSGGMGSVFLARHPRLPRWTALKVLAGEFSTDDESRARFAREADLVAALDHPNIVSIYDRGVDAGRLWISMQFVDGTDAAHLDAATLSPRRAARIVTETARALDYAHSVGVLHRDVKPANIMLGRAPAGEDERVLLADFGIARLRDDTKHLTRTGVVTATLTYASPEQLSALPVDHRSDQYSLACTLFRLLCGTTPFEAGHAGAVITGHLHLPPPPVSERRPGLPVALDEIVRKALAKHPDDRFTSCREFTKAVWAALDTTPTINPRVLPTVRVDHPPSTDHPSEPSRPHAEAASTISPPTAPPPRTPAPTSPSPVDAAPSTPIPAQTPAPSLPDAEQPPRSPRYLSLPPDSPELSLGSLDGLAGPREQSPRYLGVLPDEPESRPSILGRLTGPADTPAQPRGASTNSASHAPKPAPIEAFRRAPGQLRPPSTTRRFLLPASAAALVVAVGVAGAVVWTTRDSAAPVRPSDGTAVAAPVGSFTAIGQLDSHGSQRSPLTVTPVDPAGDGTATCPATSIALAGAMTGPDAALGQNVRAGAELALDRFTRANPGCTVTLKTLDTTGSPATAATVIPTATADPSVLAMIGPVFSGETKATGTLLSDAGLPFLTPSATNPTLTTAGYRTFFRGLANDDLQGPAIARYMLDVVGHRSVCVVHDDTQYGTGLAAAVTAALGPAALAACGQFTVRTGESVDSVARQVYSAGPVAVFYAGYAQDAGDLVRQLRAAGSNAPFYSGDGALDPSFTRAAAGKAVGSTLTCPCAPAPADFTTAYRTLHNTAPGVYSVEAYDLTTIVLRGIASGARTRAALADYLRTYSGAGLGRMYSWTQTGELVDARIWLYRSNS
ncbi:bifunctional serine/threonine-protein kinase/ABC transporter substrate-binding protein [Nocardia lasii]|uniref:non-specific serine/threonine protein kinase n=1 Tax=Nocardia lasii TaxID=1616107 RepID=A0ABW1JPI4_9NOCA